MNRSFFYYTLIAMLFIAVSCEKSELKSIPEIDDEVLALVEEEIRADNNADDLLAEADDGLFWGDTGLSFLKSGDKDRFRCASMDFNYEDGKTTLTLDFAGGDCNKSGTIIIEYIRPDDAKRFVSKSITFIDFSHGKGAVFNGSQTINREEGNYKTESEITIEKENEDGATIIVVRKSSKEIEWICGPGFGGNNISKVSGQTSVTKTIDGEETSYSKEIVEPLLMVRKCDFKVQAGVVNISKPDGTEISIDYGTAPEEIDCDTAFECDNTIDVTKDGVTETITVDEGHSLKRKKGKNNK